MTGYLPRNRILRELGHDSYAAYLNSPTWATICAAMLADRPWCCGCGVVRATQIHHVAYSRENLRGLTRAGLVAVCDRCHEFAEYDGPRKTSLDEANRRLKSLWHPADRRVTMVASTPTEPPMPRYSLDSTAATDLYRWIEGVEASRPPETPYTYEFAVGDGHLNGECRDAASVIQVPVQ